HGIIHVRASPHYPFIPAFRVLVTPYFFGPGFEVEEIMYPQAIPKPAHAPALVRRRCGQAERDQVLGFRGDEHGGILAVDSVRFMYLIQDKEDLRPAKVPGINPGSIVERAVLEAFRFGSFPVRHEIGLDTERGKYALPGWYNG